MVNDDETYHSRFMGFFVEKYWSSQRVFFLYKKVCCSEIQVRKKTFSKEIYG